MIKKENKVLQEMRKGYLKQLKKTTGVDFSKNNKLKKILDNLTK